MKPRRDTNKFSVGVFCAKQQAVTSMLYMTVQQLLCTRVDPGEISCLEVTETLTDTLTFLV